MDGDFVVGCILTFHLSSFCDTPLFSTPVISMEFAFNIPLLYQLYWELLHFVFLAGEV